MKQSKILPILDMGCLFILVLFPISLFYFLQFLLLKYFSLGVISFLFVKVFFHVFKQLFCDDFDFYRHFFVVFCEVCYK